MDALSRRETNPALNHLVERSLAAAAKSRKAAPTYDLAPVVAAAEHRGHALVAIRDALRHELTCSTPPPELTSAMRRPCGSPCLVRLAIHGRSAHVVVYPIGVWSPAREAAVWGSITQYVHGRGKVA